MKNVAAVVLGAVVTGACPLPTAEQRQLMANPQALLFACCR